MQDFSPDINLGGLTIQYIGLEWEVGTLLTNFLLWFVLGSRNTFSLAPPSLQLSTTYQGKILHGKKIEIIQ